MNNNRPKVDLKNEYLYVLGRVGYIASMKNQDMQKNEADLLLSHMENLIANLTKRSANTTNNDKKRNVNLMKNHVQTAMEHVKKDFGVNATMVNPNTGLAGNLNTLRGNNNLLQLPPATSNVLTINKTGSDENTDENGYNSNIEANNELETPLTTEQLTEYITGRTASLEQAKTGGGKRRTRKTRQRKTRQRKTHERKRS